MELETRNKPPDIYVKDHEKYTVHLRCLQTPEGGIPKIKTATKVFQIIGEKCVFLNKISRDTVRIDCDSKNTANQLIIDQPFEGYVCYIPFFAKYSVGVLRDIDTELSENDIMNMFPNAFEKVFRMYRFNRENNKREPTRSVKVFIECDNLPDYVTVYGLRCRVHLFTQRVRICFKCHRFGHHENNCRAEIRKCLNCGRRCASECVNKMQCTSCNSDEHHFGDEKCPVRRLEENIIKVMNNNKLSYFGAKNWIKENVCADAFSCIVREKVFPTINESLNRKTKKLNKAEVNNKISLDIITMVNEIKNLNEKKSIPTRQTTRKEEPDQHKETMEITTNTSEDDETLSKLKERLKQNQKPKKHKNDIKNTKMKDIFRKK